MKNYDLYGGLIQLQFTESSHRYKVSVDGEDFRPVRGVTTLLDTFIPKPFLIQWAAGLAADTFRDSISDFLNTGKQIDTECLNTIHTASKKAHTVRRDRGADVGTSVHYFIEEYLTNKNPSIPEDPQAAKAVEGFKEFIEKNKPEFESTEQPVYSKTYDYAGTYDAIMTINGKRYMTDWKSSDPAKVYKSGKPTGEVKAYASHVIQCAAYDIAYTEALNLPDDYFDGHAVIYVTKSGKVYDFYNTGVTDNKSAFVHGLKLSKRLKELE